MVILGRAEVNGIREEARRLGEGYFRSLFEPIDIIKGSVDNFFKIVNLRKPWRSMEE